MIRLKNYMFLIFAVAACQHSPYYEGISNHSNSSHLTPSEVTCYDSDGFPTKVGKKMGHKICTADLGLQYFYCTNPDNKLPYSIRAKNIKFGDESKSCVRSKKMRTGGVWKDPKEAMTIAIDHLKGARKIICDFTLYEPFIKHEMDLGKSVMDSHGNFKSTYEVPIKTAFTTVGKLEVETVDSTQDYQFSIYYDSDGANPGYDFSGIRYGDDGKKKFSCTVL